MEILFLLPLRKLLKLTKIIKSSMTTEFILNNINGLLLVAGVIMIGSALAPMLSKNFTDEDKSNLFSKKEKLVFNKYIRQVDFLIVGTMIVAYTLYKLFL